MKRVKVRQQRSHFGKERVSQNGGDLFLPATARVSYQLAHIDIERLGQALEGTERRDRLAVLDFRNVCPRHLHPTGQLTLAQVPGAADLTHLCRNLQTGFGSGGLAVRNRHRPERGYFLDVEGFVAAAAKRIAGAELNQRAMFAADNFARVKTH